MTISKDRVKPSPLPDSWKLKEIFATGIVLGGYLALMTVIFFWLMKETDFFPVRQRFLRIYRVTVLNFKVVSLYSFDFCLTLVPLLLFQEKFGVRRIRDSDNEMMAALYLQVSIVSQALIFVTRSRSWSYSERPGLLLMSAFCIAQLVRIMDPRIPFRQYLLEF